MSRWARRSASCSRASRATSETASAARRRRRRRSAPPTESAEPTEGTPAELLAQADELLTEANDALTAGRLGEYQEKVDQAGALIDQALELLQPSTAGG